jgi:hypothetical protein
MRDGFHHGCQNGCDQDAAIGGKETRTHRSPLELEGLPGPRAGQTFRTSVPGTVSTVNASSVTVSVIEALLWLELAAGRNPPVRGGAIDVLLIVKVPVPLPLKATYASLIDLAKSSAAS